jgi:prepilin-type N-terminal cleavage/methylation domain-containing protein
MRRGPAAAGFSLIELVIAMAVLAAALAIAIRLAAFGQQAARLQPEAADQLQRLRVAVSMLQRDLAMAGGGPLHGPDAGPLGGLRPAVVPARTGARLADPELSFFDDRISIGFVPYGAVSAAVTAAMPTPAADVMIDPAGAGCPSSGLCGFSRGRRALLFDTGSLAAGADPFTVQATGPGLSHGAPDPPFSRPYAPGTGRVVPFEQHVYYLDRAGRRLMLYDGSESDLPLVDDVVALEFSYWLDPGPAVVRPPPDGQANCAFAAGSPPVPILADLGGQAPVRVGSPTLTDGPVCGLSPQRFDADLLRVRRVGVRLRLQVGDIMLRGTGPAFAVPGRSPGGPAVAADVEVAFDVRLRNAGYRP